MKTSQPVIAVVGSLNMDLVVSANRMPRMGETLQGNTIQYIPGGKGANQAVACAKLGAQVSMIGAVGDDVFGAQIMKNMKQHGVPTEYISMVQGSSTGTATIIHTPQDNCIVIVPGANDACTPEVIEASATAITAADILIVQLEIPLPSVTRALQIAKAAGVTTVLNPAPAQPLTAELLQLADVITPNESEFDILLGSGHTEEESERQLQERLLDWQTQYDQFLVVTRGAQGVSYLENNRISTIAAPKVNVVDTTGAGDCFNGALCYGLAMKWNWEQALSFAVKAASLSVQQFGAQAGMPELQMVMQSQIADI